MGPQNCGKSTLVKYLLNRMRGSVTASTKLFVLDIDCGQPTFNLPGTIALLREAEATRTAQVKPTLNAVRETFLNSPNPATDPEAYLQVISELIDDYHSVTGPKKLLVNTCGWVEGLGAEILMRLIYTIQETLCEGPGTKAKL